MALKPLQKKQKEAQSHWHTGGSDFDARRSISYDRTGGGGAAKPPSGKVAVVQPLGGKGWRQEKLICSHKQGWTLESKEG